MQLCFESVFDSKLLMEDVKHCRPRLGATAMNALYHALGTDAYVAIVGKNSHVGTSLAVTGRNTASTQEPLLHFCDKFNHYYY